MIINRLNTIVRNLSMLIECGRCDAQARAEARRLHSEGIELVVPLIRSGLTGLCTIHGRLVDMGTQL
jgi:hypothetical protein